MEGKYINLYSIVNISNVTLHHFEFHVVFLNADMFLKRYGIWMGLANFCVW